jgi:signal transduction histidine kinase/ActR/RegA family two-component response regulator
MSSAHWQNTPFTIPLLFIGLLCAWLAFVTWRRRAVPGAPWFAMLMAALAGWTLVNALEKSLVAYEPRRLVSTFVYLFIVTVPAAWLAFAFRFSRQERWLPRRVVPLLFLEPVLVMVLVLTDHWHGLFRASTEMARPGPYAVMVIRHGPLFWVHAAYTYLVFVLGAGLLVVGLTRRPGWTIGRLVVLLAGLLVPMLGNVAYLGGLQPDEFSDLTPVYFAVSGLAAAWMLFHVRIFDVLPIARDRVLDCLSDAILVLDTHQRFLDANRAARALLPEPPLPGRPLAALLPELAQLPALRAIAAAVHTELTLSRGGRETVWDVDVQPILDEEVPIGVLVRLSDVSERKRAEAEHRAAEEKLRHRQQRESLGVMAGGMAHDFNNLLSLIIGNAELARGQVGPASPAAPFLRDAVKAADWGASLTRQMLTYAGKTRFVLERVSLTTLIGGIGDMLRSAVARQANLEFDLVGDLPPLLGDPAQLRQLVFNLVTNASEALGGQPGSICVRTRLADVKGEDLAAAAFNAGLAPGRHLLLEVADTGAGMDAATVARVFEPFFTTKATGRGLGLPVVLGVVRAHGGAIFVHSEVGAGTQVRVVLSPLEVRADVAPRSTFLDPSQRPRAAGTVLVIDKEEHLCRVAEQFLRRDGFQVLTAVDGADGLRTFQRHAGEIEVVLLDLTLPVLSGPALYRRLRELDPQLPIVLTSGYDEEAVWEQFPASERSAFLRKPYRGDDLTAKVREMLGKRRQAPVGP